LFDAIASVIDLRQKVRFEGQAAMELEFLAESPLKLSASWDGTRPEMPYAFEFGDRVLDWGPMVLEILDDVTRGVAPQVIARRFHVTLAASMVLIAEHVSMEKVVLTGGCFQNKLLTEIAVERLQRAGFRPYWHQRVPPNDGGIALGQVIAAQQELAYKG
jgi:hydrogenase maturation protein HypF